MGLYIIKPVCRKPLQWFAAKYYHRFAANLYDRFAASVLRDLLQGNFLFINYSFKISLRDYFLDIYYVMIE